MGLQIWPIPWWLPVWKLLRYQRVPLIPITSPEMPSESEWICIYIYRIKQIYAPYRHTSLLLYHHFCWLNRHVGPCMFQLPWFLIHRLPQPAASASSNFFNSLSSSSFSLRQSNFSNESYVIFLHVVLMRFGLFWILMGYHAISPNNNGSLRDY